jgi:hypothetical protein
MSDRFLEQLIKVKFSVKLGKNASDICAVLFEVHGGQAIKKSSVFEWHILFKYSFQFEIINEDNVHPFLRFKGMVLFNSSNNAKQSTKPFVWKY